MIAIPPLDFQSIDHDQFRHQLRMAFAVFNEIDQPLRDRVVDYLIDGSNTEVLLDLRAALRVPDRPRFFDPRSNELVPIDYKLAAHLLTLFKQPITPAGYYRRLGYVCSQYEDLHRAWATYDARLPKWYNDLLRFAIALKLRAPSSIPSKEFRCDLTLVTADLNEVERDQLLSTLMQDNHGNAREIGSTMGHFASTTRVVELYADRLLELARHNASLHDAIVLVFANHYASPGRHLAEVIDYGLVASRHTKSEFRSLLEDHRTEAKPILARRLRDGSPQQRLRAAEWLNKLYGRAIAAELADALANEADKKVAATIEKLYAVYREADQYERMLAERLTLPPVVIDTGELPLPSGFAVNFQKFLDEAAARSRSQYKQQLHDYSDDHRDDETPESIRPMPPAPPSPDDLLGIYLYMEGKSTAKPPSNKWLFQLLLSSPAVERWCDPRELKLLQLLRLLDAIGSLQERFSALTVYHTRLLNAHRLAQEHPYGLLELDAAAEQLLGRPHLVSRGFLMEPARYELEDDAIWPAFVGQQSLLETSIEGLPLDQYDRNVASRRQTALYIAGLLPVLPRKIEEAAWQLALADGWTLRPLARPLLKRQPNCVQRAIAALGHRSGGARMGAAEILQELGATEAIAPLKKALNKEKLKPVQGHLLAALEKLGANVDEYIGREKLLEDATRGDQRMQRSMAWFPLDEMPPVRWASDNQPLPKKVLRWWMMQCVEFKSTTCSPIMRRALQLCRRDDTLRLAHFILDQWISFDTNEPERAEIEKRFRAKAQELACVFNWAGKNSPEAIDDYVNRMVKQELRDIQRQQSAHTERGLLAIVAAFGDAACVEKMEKYIRNYHGNRALQAKSMLEVIPQIDEPISLRVIRSLAAGFRNAAICKRAGELFREMSARYGWSEDELAERILPDAGFAIQASDAGEAAQPEMLLSYGCRQFRVCVDDDFQISVIHADGKQSKDLPPATKEDDKTLVRVAKEQLKTARAILATTASQLTERLSQAMCDARSWCLKDWRELLVEHPLAGIACRRLIWSHQPTGDMPATHFQVLRDGSLVDAAGKQIDLADDGFVLVANLSQMEPAEAHAWVNRLTSQNLRPLFAQTESVDTLNW